MFRSKKTPDGITYEADEKHAKRIIQNLDLVNANGITTPFFKEEKQNSN